MKKLIKNILYIFGIYLTGVFILSILCYIGLINDKVCKCINFIMFIIIIYFNGNRKCIRKCNNKLLYSIYLGLSIDIIFFIVSIILKSFKPKLVLYYIIIILVSILSTFRKKK